jgi:hypothetical protein
MLRSSDARRSNIVVQLGDSTHCHLLGCHADSYTGAASNVQYGFPSEVTFFGCNWPVTSFSSFSAFPLLVDPDIRIGPDR